MVHLIGKLSEQVTRVGWWLLCGSSPYNSPVFSKYLHCELFTNRYS